MKRQYLEVRKKKNLCEWDRKIYTLCSLFVLTWLWDRNICSSQSTFVITSSRMMPNGDPTSHTHDRFLYPTPLLTILKIIFFFLFFEWLEWSRTLLWRWWSSGSESWKWRATIWTSVSSTPTMPLKYMKT